MAKVVVIGARYRMAVLRRNPSSFSSFPQNKGKQRYLFLGPDASRNAREIAKFSKKDAVAYPKYERILDKITPFVEDIFTATPPNLSPCSWADWQWLSRVVGRGLKLGPLNGYRFAKMMLWDARYFLDSWFESDELKATLLTNATIGSSTMKVNLLLSGLPRFKCLQGTMYNRLSDQGVGPQYLGTIYLSPSVDYISRAVSDGVRGIPSYFPMLEMTIPSVVDKTLAPVGKYLVNMLVQCMPYNLRNVGPDGWRDPKFVEECFEKRVKGVMRQHIENVDDIIEDKQILTPLDAEA